MRHDRDVDDHKGHRHHCKQLGNLYGILNRRNHGNLPLRHNRDIDDLADELQVRRNRSFLHCHDKHLLLHTNKHATTLSKNWRTATIFSASCNCGSRLSSPQPAPENLCDLHNKDMDHLVDVLQQGDRYGLQTDGTMGISLCDSTKMLMTLSTRAAAHTSRCTTTGMSTTSKNCTWRERSCLYDTTGMSCTPTTS